MKPPISRPLRQLVSIPLFWVITIPLAVSALGSLAGMGYFSYRNHQVVGHLAQYEWQAMLLGLLVLFVLINLKIITAYDNCWYGRGAWDAREWFDLLLKMVYVK